MFLSVRVNRFQDHPKLLLKIRPLLTEQVSFRTNWVVSISFPSLIFLKLKPKSGSIELCDRVVSDEPKEESCHRNSCVT